MVGRCFRVATRAISRSLEQRGRHADASSTSGVISLFRNTLPVEEALAETQAQTGPFVLLPKT
jgi:hypothetical protein